jgi:hypothetical protein
VTWGFVGVGVDGGGEPWADLGFEIVDDSVALRNGAVLIGTSGLVVHAIDEAGSIDTDIDGVGVTVADAALPSTVHPNGAADLDHVVVMTESLERTSAAIDSVLGLPCLRIRETEHVRQAFHRFPDAGGSRGCIVEVVESARVSGTTVWGLVVNVVDIDATCHRLGPDVVGAPKAAVQPRRRIATVRREAGLPLAVAFMTPT